MGQMVNRGNEIIRICPNDEKKIEFSTNGGRNWQNRYSSVNNSCGEFYDLADNGKEILAETSKGLYFSTNEGRNWSKRG